MSLFEAGDVERAWEMMQALGSDDLEHKIPVERCFDWEVLALARSRAGPTTPPTVRPPRRGARRGARAGCGGARRRARAALLLSRGDAAEPRGSRARRRLAASIGARLPAAFALALAGRALVAAGRPAAAIAVLRAPSGARRVRLAPGARRDAARAAQARRARRAARAGDAADSGLGSLTKREREIAELVTRPPHQPRDRRHAVPEREDRRDAPAELFVKLGASSRVEVARALERERRG